MTIRLVIEPEAEADLLEAYRWYESRRPGLGRELLDCVETTFERICQHPKSFAVVHRNVRQTLVRRFPYVVCYVLENDEVDVIAVFHGHRDPTAWQFRVGNEG